MRKNKNYRQAVDWLYAAFHLTPEEVLREPTAGELCSKVFRMVKAACVSGLADGAVKGAWLEYVHPLT